MKARAPSPSLSAILPRQASTSARAVVRPASRSAAREARVGALVIAHAHSVAVRVIARSEATKQSKLSLRLLDCFASLAMTILEACILDRQLQQRGTQRLAMRVERQRPRDAAAQRARHDEIQRGDVGQFIAHYLAFDHAGKMRFDPLA